MATRQTREKVHVFSEDKTIALKPDWSLIYLGRVEGDPSLQIDLETQSLGDLVR